MLQFQLEQLDQAKLQQLCDDRVTETQTLEFKRELPGKELDHKSEFLKDVAALANAEGGDLIYGVQEQAGSAYSLVPISSPLPDGAGRTLRQILDGGMEPRITGIRMHAVDVDEGYVLVLRVPQSYDGPHRVTSGMNKGRFVSRSGTGTSDMSYDQLRSAFDRTSSLMERARAFRLERLEAIRSGATPKLVDAGPKCVAHLISLSGMAGRQQVDVVKLARNPGSFFIQDWGHPSSTLNLEGIVAHQATYGQQMSTYGYNQIFRTGCAEGVFMAGVPQAPDEKKLLPAAIDLYFREVLKQNLALLKAEGLTGPAVIGLALTGIDDHMFYVDTRRLGMRRTLADRDVLLIPELWIENLDSVDLDDVVRPLLDILWQSFGIERCFDYAQDGTWQPPR